MTYLTLIAVVVVAYCLSRSGAIASVALLVAAAGAVYWVGETSNSHLDKPATQSVLQTEMQSVHTAIPDGQRTQTQLDSNDALLAGGAATTGVAVRSGDTVLESPSDPEVPPADDSAEKTLSVEPLAAPAASATSDDGEDSLEIVLTPVASDELPKWIGDDRFAGSVHHASVSSSPKVSTELAAEDAWLKVKQLILDDLRTHHPGVHEDTVTVEAIKAAGVVEEGVAETREMNLTGGFKSPMHIVHYRIEVSAADRSQLVGAYRQNVGEERLRLSGLIVLALTVVTSLTALTTSWLTGRSKATV